jgi:hypothetical protein
MTPGVVLKRRLLGNKFKPQERNRFYEDRNGNIHMVNQLIGQKGVAKLGWKLLADSDGSRKYEAQYWARQNK